MVPVQDVGGAGASKPPIGNEGRGALVVMIPVEMNYRNHRT